MRKALPTFFSTDFIKDTIANPGQISQPIVERPVKYVFTIASGVNTGQEFVIENPPAKIGRGSGVSIRLDEDMGVSRQHAEVYMLNGNLRIRDLNSTHGTKVNGVRIEDISLKPGDRIEIGLTALVVREIQER